MLQTLEQKTEVTERRRIKTTVRECHYCHRELQIPEEVIRGLRNNKEKTTNRHSNGFYISPCGSVYCDKYCFDMFTED